MIRTHADLSFDVSVATNQPASQAAWLFLPADLPAARAVIVCYHGASYDKQYWHYEIAGHPDYSFALHLVRLGYVVVAVDHLGTGSSSDLEGGVPYSLELLSRSNSEVVRQIRQHIEAGEFGALPKDIPFLGVGHSLGAAVTMRMQGTSGDFDAVALLGLGLAISDIAESPLQHSAQTVGAVEASMRSTFGIPEGAVSMTLPRAAVRAVFHSSDVPEAVVAADDARESRAPVRAGAETLAPGLLVPYAEAISVPIFLAFGAVTDMSDNPHAEPARFPNSGDVTLFLVPGSGHCHNLANERQLLWDRLASWLETVLKVSGA